MRGSEGATALWSPKGSSGLAFSWCMVSSSVKRVDNLLLQALWADRTRGGREAVVGRPPQDCPLGLCSVLDGCGDTSSSDGWK